MRRVNKNSADTKWLRALGMQVEKVILAKGYDSIYDFWVKEAGDTISRATLNYIVAGTGDPKASTLKAIAHLLGAKVSRFFEFEN